MFRFLNSRNSSKLVVFSDQILKQLLNIASALDAFGAPSTLSRSIEHGVGGLLFNGDFGGFLSDLSHGLTNSVAKVKRSFLRKDFLG